MGVIAEPEGITSWKDALPFLSAMDIVDSDVASHRRVKHVLDGLLKDGVLAMGRWGLKPAQSVSSCQVESASDGDADQWLSLREMWGNVTCFNGAIGFCC